MAHKKGLGSTRNGRDSHSQRLGVGRGKDDTLFALCEGTVEFTKSTRRNKGYRRFVHVRPLTTESAE